MSDVCCAGDAAPVERLKRDTEPATERRGVRQRQRLDFEVSAEEEEAAPTPDVFGPPSLPSRPSVQLGGGGGGSSSLAQVMGERPLQRIGNREHLARAQLRCHAHRRRAQLVDSACPQSGAMPLGRDHVDQHTAGPARPRLERGAGDKVEVVGGDAWWRRG